MGKRAAIYLCNPSLQDLLFLPREYPRLPTKSVVEIHPPPPPPLAASSACCKFLLLKRDGYIIMKFLTGVWARALSVLPAVSGGVRGPA